MSDKQYMNHIVIFGAGSAIAQETAKLWAKKGTSFVLLDKNAEHLQIVADDLRTRGAKDVHTIPADFSDLSKHHDLIKQIHKTLPQTSQPTETSYLIAYGTLGDQKKGEQDFSVAEKEIITNFTSVASLLTELINYLQANASASEATVAVISSVAGDRGRQSNYIYGTAKAALTSFLSGLRNRLSKDSSNIHILTIKPGMVDTPMTAHMKKGLLFAKPEKIARDIVAAVDKKKDVIYTPWFWRYVMVVIKLIPERFFKRLTL